jgi:hypothetical protein
MLYYFHLTDGDEVIRDEVGIPYFRTAGMSGPSFRPVVRSSAARGGSEHLLPITSKPL